ncbi:copper homeostasis protein CutC [Oscillospiraceae bacterium 38-13]
MSRGQIEGCVDSHASALAACRGGADRLELCANLSIGGTTPSLALFRQVRRDCETPVNVLIRPRFGDFLYSPAEVEEMEDCVRRFRELGAQGVVLGALTPSGALDEAVMSRFMEAAGDMEVTLHRAFDMTRDPLEALEAAVRLGCRTILTSGQQRDALAGAETLRALRERAAGRIALMAGSGVRKENIRDIHARTGVLVFHTSGRRGPVDSGMLYRRSTVSMGLPSLSEYELWRIDEEEFQACADIVHSL